MISAPYRERKESSQMWHIRTPIAWHLKMTRHSHTINFLHLLLRFEPITYYSCGIERLNGRPILFKSEKLTNYTKNQIEIEKLAVTLIGLLLWIPKIYISSFPMPYTPAVHAGQWIKPETPRMRKSGSRYMGQKDTINELLTFRST